MVGEATYSLMRDLCSPQYPESKTFEELVKLVSDHLEPQRSEIAERHVFRLRRQHGGESLTEYLQSLKHLATTCNFGTTLGLLNEAIRSRIFAERNIRYKEAIELALALEAAERHAEMSAATAAADAGAGAAGATGAGEGLHQASARRAYGTYGGGRSGAAAAQPRRPGPSGAAAANRRGCWRCVKAHRPDKYQFVHYNCDECGVRGHLKVMCNEVRSSVRTIGQHNYVSEEDDSEDFYNIQVDDTGDEPYFININVDRRSIKFKVDTGSRISTISETFYQRNFSHKVVKPDNLNLRSYVCSRMESLGRILVDLVLENVVAKDCELHVIRKGGRPLLGREWVRALKINNIVIKLNEIQEVAIGDDPLVNRLISEYPQVFTDKLGTVENNNKNNVTREFY